MERRKFYCWLCNKSELSDRQRIGLAEAYQSFEDLLQDKQFKYKDILGKKGSWFEGIVNRLQIDRQYLSQATQTYDRLRSAGIFFCHKQEETFPERLQNIPDPPMGLFYKGTLMREQGAVAVIGARECSYYGQAMAKALGEALGQKKIAVVSGMARGIDGIAQAAALAAGGASYGVLGCGVDICYPRSNSKLYDNLIKGGAILSAYPPGTQAIATNFPPRNRIVSGLADVVVVVEAGRKSGTLITVDMALEQGKEVWVVPGRMDDRLSIGCNRLISQGAQILWDISEFIEQMETKFFDGVKQEEMVWSEENDTTQQDGVKQEKKALKRQIIQTLEYTPVTVEEILGTLNGHFTLGELQISLMELVLEGKAVQPATGYFCKNR